MHSPTDPPIPNWLWRIACRCFRTQIVDFHCASIRAGRSVTLPSAVLGSAHEIKFVFSLRRPLFALRNPAPLSVRLFAGGVPVSETIARHCWSRRHITEFEAAFPGRLLDGLSKVAVELTSAAAQSRLARFRVRVLGPLQAQRFRAGLLRAESRRLWIQSGSSLQIGDLVPDTSDALTPEFTIPATALCATLPACARRIRFDLISGRRRIQFGSRTAFFCGDAVKIRGPRISLCDYFGMGSPGNYRIAASLDGRELAAFPFRILAKGEWLDLVDVWPSGLAAETSVGGLIMRSHTLCRNRHVAFRPCLHFKTTVPAPNTQVRCQWRLMSEISVLGRGEFVARLRSPVESISLDRFDLRGIEREARNRDTRLWLTVELEGKRKLSWPIAVVGRDPVSNFEGQLFRDADEFAVDEEAYSEIIAGLTPLPRNLRGK